MRGAEEVERREGGAVANIEAPRRGVRGLIYSGFVILVYDSCSRLGVEHHLFDGGLLRLEPKPELG